MSNKPYKGFEPKWLLTPAPAGSYRSIFRWGDPEFFKYPKESLYKMMKEAFHMTDEDFRDYTDDIGFDQVSLPDHPSRIAPEHLQALREIVGEDFVTTDDYARLSVAYGCTGYDLLRLRHKQIDSLPDVVVYPDTTEQVEELVHYAAEHKLPLYVYGGGSSVTRGVEPIKGGISLDMRRNFNKVIKFNETDQTITVQAGMSGPKLEQTLQNAQSLFGAKRPYTCGHFPQSFEYSSSFFSISSRYMCLTRLCAGSMAFFLGSRTYFFTGTFLRSSSATRLFEWHTRVVMRSITSVSNRSDISNAALA